MAKYAYAPFCLFVLYILAKALDFLLVCLLNKELAAMHDYMVVYPLIEFSNYKLQFNTANLCSPVQWG
jgi:hypothetical protein